MSFNDLKKKSQETYSKLSDSLKNENAYPKDERLWYPATDKAGNGSAVIRFLPAPAGEDEPWVKLIRHSFKEQSSSQTRSPNSRIVSGTRISKKIRHSIAVRSVRCSTTRISTSSRIL